ncbi:MAG: peptidase S8 [Opitutaceae bacterium]|nr:peptidase S8 [Opitutaceae bacterium]
MRVRPFYLFSLVAGVSLSLLLIWLLQWKGPAWRSALVPSSSTASAAPRPAAVVSADRTVGMGILGKQTAQDLLASLQQLLERTNARLHEGVLTIRDAEAYRRFLDRARPQGITVLGQMDALRTVRVRYDSLADLQRDLLQNAADYTEVGANYLMRIPSVPAKEDRAAVNQVPFGNDMLAFLGVTGDHSQWGRGTTIAVLDSGVASDATIGQGRLRYLDVGQGTTVGSGAEDGHGTAVAALAAGFAPDAPGVAPAAGILSLRVTNADGTSDIFTVAQAILAAVDAGAQIINISMGGYATSSTLTRAIDYATEHSAVIVAAAGNDQAAQLTWPAADARVISVGAIDALEQQVLFSNSGPQLQMTAPGFGVQTAWLDGQRVLLDGTSASAPIVAGAIAAMMSQNPQLNAVQAWQILQQSANDAGAPGDDPDYGNGILNVGWAMNHANPAYGDTAVSSHYYNPAKNEMEFVVQNRSGQAIAGMTLDVTAGGATSSYRVPLLNPGAIFVVAVGVDPAALNAAGHMNFVTQLNNPPGFVDQVPANNRKGSSLSPLAKK